MSLKRLKNRVNGKKELNVAILPDFHTLGITKHDKQSLGGSVREETQVTDEILDQIIFKAT